MAKIIDPDDVTSRLSTAGDAGEDIIYNISTSRITIRDTAGGGTNIDPADGISFQAFYSKCMEDWKDLDTLQGVPFPLEPIGTGTQFDFIDLWNLENAPSRQLLKDGGYAVRATKGANSTEEWACIVTLGDFEVPASHTAYWQFVLGGATFAADDPGVVNELVQIWRDDNADGTPDEDYRSPGSAYFKIWLREQAHIYDQYDLVTEQSLGELTYEVYKLPLSNRPDLKVTQSDAYIDANAPYTGMGITWLLGEGFAAWANATPYPANSVVSSVGRWYYTVAGGTSSGTGVADDVGVTWVAYSGERQLGANYYPFNIIVTGNGGTKEEIYEYLQRQLRQAGDINSGATGQEDPAAYLGEVTDLLAQFAGDTLNTEQGVFLDGLAAGDKNSVNFYDATNVARTYPALATITITCSETMVNDATAWLRLMFTDDDPPGDDLGYDFGTANAITVREDQTDGLTEIAEAGGVLASQQYSYEFDENVQRGSGSAGSAVPLTLVGGGASLGGAAYVRTSGTMASAAGITLSLVAPQDRAYKT